jgi:opacity protein-like surface antigen
MRFHRSIGLALLLFAGAAAADRQPGWEFGGELVYQMSQDLSFKGGSTASLDDDVGAAMSFTYRFTPRLELLIGVDWNMVDYDVTVAPGDAAAGLGFSATGELEYWTPRVGVNFNFLEGDLTPYVTGALGWSFIDTNIPDSPPQTACWWDPWWGYYCGTYQNTRSIDTAVYDFGAGLRWDVSSSITLRLAYERHWLDLDEANGTPGFDQVKLGISGRY